MRKPFDITYRPKIESGEYKVVTENGCPVAIYRWDFFDKDGTPILGSYVMNDLEFCAGWSNKGKFNIDGSYSNYDLYVEYEPDQFESGLMGFLSEYNELPKDKDGMLNRKDIESLIDKYSESLLWMAQEKLIDKGYVLFREDDENIPQEAKKMIAEAMYKRLDGCDFTEQINNILYQPVWKHMPFGGICHLDNSVGIEYIGKDDIEVLRKGNYYLSIDELDKLPKEK